jgi:hypothetical protein
LVLLFTLQVAEIQNQIKPHALLSLWYLAARKRKTTTKKLRVVRKDKEEGSCCKSMKRIVTSSVLLFCKSFQTNGGMISSPGRLLKTEKKETSSLLAYSDLGN